MVRSLHHRALTSVSVVNVEQYNTLGDKNIVRDALGLFIIVIYSITFSKCGLSPFYCVVTSVTIENTVGLVHRVLVGVGAFREGGIFVIDNF